MGYTATWTPSAGGDIQTATILFKTPTDIQKEGEIKYSPFSYVMEYKSLDFVALKASVDANNDEYVFITDPDNVITSYYVKQCNFKWDGATVEAILSIPNPS